MLPKGNCFLLASPSLLRKNIYSAAGNRLLRVKYLLWSSWVLMHVLLCWEGLVRVVMLRKWGDANAQFIRVPLISRGHCSEGLTAREGLCLLGLPSPGATPAVPRAFVPPPVGAWSKVGKCFLSVRIRWAGWTIFSAAIFVGIQKRSRCPLVLSGVMGVAASRTESHRFPSLKPYHAATMTAVRMITRSWKPF